MRLWNQGSCTRQIKTKVKLCLKAHFVKSCPSMKEMFSVMSFIWTVDHHFVKAHLCWFTPLVHKILFAEFKCFGCADTFHRGCRNSGEECTQCSGYNLLTKWCVIILWLLAGLLVHISPVLNHDQTNHTQNQ